MPWIIFTFKEDVNNKEKIITHCLFAKLDWSSMFKSLPTELGYNNLHSLLWSSQNHQTHDVRVIGHTFKILSETPKFISTTRLLTLHLFLASSLDYHYATDLFNFSFAKTYLGFVMSDCVNIKTPFHMLNLYYKINHL